MDIMADEPAEPTAQPDKVAGDIAFARAVEIFNENRVTEAADLMWEAKDMYSVDCGTESLEVANACLELGAILDKLHRFEEAMFELNTALRIRIRVFGDTHPCVGRVLDRQGLVYKGLGRLHDSLSKHEQAASILREQSEGGTMTKEECIQWYSDAGATILNIANILYTQGKYDLALLRYKEALNIRRKQQGPSAELGTACAQMGLANVYYSLARYPEALREHEEVLAVRLKLLGRDFVNVFASLVNIGSVLVMMNQSEVDTPSGAGRDSVNVAASLVNIGSVLVMMNKSEEALAKYKEALEIEVEIYGGVQNGGLGVAATLNNIGSVLFNLKRYDEAIAKYQESLGISERLLGPRHASVARTKMGMANVVSMKGDHHKALEMYREALAIQENQLGRGHADVAATIMGMANTFYRMKENEDALQHYEDALAIKRTVLGSGHIEVSILLMSIANVLFQTGKRNDAMIRYAEIYETSNAATINKLFPWGWQWSMFNGTWCSGCSMRMESGVSGQEALDVCVPTHEDQINLCCLCGGSLWNCSGCAFRKKHGIRYKGKGFFKKAEEDGCAHCNKVRSAHHFRLKFCDPPPGTRPALKKQTNRHHRLVDGDETEIPSAAPSGRNYVTEKAESSSDEEEVVTPSTPSTPAEGVGTPGRGPASGQKKNPFLEKLDKGGTRIAALPKPPRKTSTLSQGSDADLGPASDVVSGKDGGDSLFECWGGKSNTIDSQGADMAAQGGNTLLIFQPGEESGEQGVDESAPLISGDGDDRGGEVGALLRDKRFDERYGGARSDEDEEPLASAGTERAPVVTDLWDDDDGRDAEGKRRGSGDEPEAELVSLT